MKKVVNISEKISFVLFCILMIDCSFMGFAAWGQFGPVASRMFVMVLTLLFAIPSLLMNWKKILSNKYVIMALIFAAILVIGAIIGVLNKNNLGLILMDFKGFSCFVILPAALVLLNSRERIHSVMKCILVGNTALALHSIATLILFLYDKLLYYKMSLVCREAAFAYYGSVTGTIPRMFYQSVMYLLCGCAFAVYFYMTSKKKSRWVYCLLAGTYLFSIILSYTRSVYLGTALAAFALLIILWVIGKKEERKNLKYCILGILISFALFLTIFGVATNTNYLKFAFLRATAGIIELPAGTGSGDDSGMDDISDGEMAYIEQTEASDDIRALTLQGLYRNIKKSPLTGIGLGAAFKERPDGRNEYVYLDMISKVGIIGLFIYMLPFAIMLRQLWLKRKQLTVENTFPLLNVIVLAGFMLASYFNPYMNGALGIFFYCFTIANVSWFETSEVECLKEN
ncbi:MAG: O-antigen ligase family protein [Agathobacter sp.]|nr:O-antigen ligase family protein [Agathobacter sp.]